MNAGPPVYDTDQRVYSTDESVDGTNDSVYSTDDSVHNTDDGVYTTVELITCACGDADGNSTEPRLRGLPVPVALFTCGRADPAPNHTISVLIKLITCRKSSSTSITCCRWRR